MSIRYTDNTLDNANYYVTPAASVQYLLINQNLFSVQILNFSDQKIDMPAQDLEFKKEEDFITCISTAPIAHLDALTSKLLLVRLLVQLLLIFMPK